MMLEHERLDGWKSIGAQFGRDRSTVIRWAQDRGMPVHALPGGKTRSVYAYRSELLAWKALADSTAASAQSARIASVPLAAPAIVVAPEGARARARLPAAFYAAAALATMLAALLALLHAAPSRDGAAPVPSDLGLRALFLQARGDWAQGTGESRLRAVTELERLTRLDPTFAPGFAGLAEAQLQAGEEGAMTDQPTAERARRAARRALELDAGSAAAHRAIAFLAYWWDHDRAAAGQAFRRALALGPRDPQTHLWYADALSDNGDQIAAIREYDAAGVLAPDSASVRSERAWALWSAGDEVGGEAELHATLAQAPQNEDAHDALGVVALAHGDVAGYAREERVAARLGADPAFTAWIDAVAQTAARHGPAAGMAAIVDRALANQATPWMGQHTDPWAAYVASLAGRRQDLLDVLREAEATHEVWGMGGYRRRIAQRWRGDAEITTLLAHRTPPPMEGVL